MQANLTLFILLLLKFCIQPEGLAQYDTFNKGSLAGIFHSYDDFERRAPMHEFVPYEQGYAIWPQGFFKHKDVEVNTPDTFVVYRRDKIWGFSDHEGWLVRIHQNNHYRVLSQQRMVIYRIYSPTQTGYYFSKTLNSSIHKLTKRKLQVVFADQPNILKRLKLISKKHWLTWDDKRQDFLLPLTLRPR